MTASRWPEWLNDIWAKSAEQGAGGEPETLAKHTWDVLARLAELIHLRPNLPQNLGVPNLWNLLFWSAFLHDFGKATDGFQAQLRPDGKRWVHRHEVLSLAFLDWISAGLTDDEQCWVAAGIVSHHKEAEEIRSLYPAPDIPDEDELITPVAEFDQASIRGLWRWLNECATDWSDALSLGNAGIAIPTLPGQDQAVTVIQQRGVAQIRHWLRAYRRFVRQIEDRRDRSIIMGCLALRGHIINADHSASAHAGAIPRIQFNADDILASRGLSRNDLFGYQLQAGVTDSSTLLTAPTGSGKTEAALLWVARQSEINQHLPRLFYTLPYQASMNAMNLRLEGSFPGLVGLQHGRSLLALYRLLLEQEYEPAEAARRARWSRNLARLNYPPVRVLSPYQMLKGMYRLKGYEAILNDYHGAAFIFDEIHAYEVKRLALILKTVEYLRQNFGARFLVMSATFPTLIKEWLREAFNDPAEISAEPSLFQAFRRHRIMLCDGGLVSSDGIRAIVNDARSGKSVLVVCNVVARAQEAYHQLRDILGGHGIHTELLHGRFNMRDRSAKERLVREAAGSKSRERRPIVLVATQVVEVSLDIDLDTIYTDPAPLEALIQRFGRVNRRGKQENLAPVHVYRQPDDGQMIYDPELVRKTLSVLEREDKRPLDESSIGNWLDEIYNGAVAERWRHEYAIAAEEFSATCIRTLRPFAADESLEKLFYRAFDGLEALPSVLYDEYKTLGDDDPIRANELLVPISWRRYKALARKNQVLPHQQGEPYIIKAGYNSEVGLTFDDFPIEGYE